MALTLILVLLFLAQGQILGQGAELGDLAGPALLIGCCAQLGAIWAFRTSLPGPAMAALGRSCSFRKTLVLAFAAVLTILGAALAANALLQVDFSSAQQILHPFVGSWLGILAVALLGPIVEEVIFRCIAIVWLSSFCRGWVAVLLAAIPFAFVHASSAEHMLFAFAAGVTLGATYQLSGSIVPGLLAHVCINSIALSQVMGHTA